ncbi:MAG: 50S ribosomal protein L13 [Candidatus Paceibacterota bacterium]|jgi:large subunit ribosomal protein L13
MDYTIDAKNKKLGRLASEIAIILQGKKTPKYEPRLDLDFKVTVKNIDKLDINAKKFETKIYKHHTGYIGHLKERTLKVAFEKSPAWVLKHAVSGMLPKNRLLAKRIKRLVIEN